MKLLAPFGLIIIVLALVIWLDDTPIGADLVFVNQNEVFTLDPQRMSYLQDLRLAHAVYEGLVRWDNADFSILPASAEGLPEVSADGLTYTFTIRDDARWSTGAPVTAHDFIYAWQRAILPDTAADYSNMFFAIAGAEAFFRWRQAQTTAFVADPWADDEAVDPASVLAMAGRMRRLQGIDEAHWPAGLASPAAFGVEAIVSELDRLEAAANEGGPTLAIELASAHACRRWLQRLDERLSRRVEAGWMWDEAQSHFRETVGLAALGDRRLVVTLRRPMAYFLDLLCFGVFCPVYRPCVEGWPADPRRAERSWHDGPIPAFDRCRWVSLNPATGKLEQKHEWVKPPGHVGNGPYVLVQWRYKRDLRLEKNPLYHGADQVRSESILALTIEDTNTAVLAFESGRVDWLVDVSADYQADMIAQRRAYEQHHAEALARLLGEGLSTDAALARLPAPRGGERRNIHVFPTFGLDFYSFNCRPTLSDGRRNPFADAAVRRAFVMSIDKREIIEHVTRLNEPVLTTLIPPGSIPGYRSPAGLSFDPARARRELESAGWADRDGDGFIENADGELFPVIDLLYSTNVPRWKWMSLNLKSQWEGRLGVRVELRPNETKFFKEELKQGKFMIARGNWYGDYGDPTTFLNLCMSTDGNNDRKYASAHVDGLLEQAAEERDPTARMRLLEECERFLFEQDVPLLPICQRVQVYMYEPGAVTGLSSHPRLTQYLWQMQVRRP